MVVLPYHFNPMTEPQARAILQWRYEGPYAVYNCPPAALEEAVRQWLDPRLAYYAARDDAEALVGFCCFGDEAQVPGGDYAADALDVGLGLRPDLTGRGLGPGFVAAVLDLGRRLLRPRRFRLTVMAANRRAIRAYEKAGFRVSHTFSQPGAPGGQEWVQLLL